MKITKGLDIPISGAPRQVITEGAKVSTIAVVGRDYKGLKPTMLVQEGDHVRIGDVLFEDKKTPGVKFTAPGAGTVRAINRGARRVLQSVVIDLDDEEEAVSYTAYGEAALDDLTREQVQEQMIESGAWTAFRTRPYGKVPKADAVPHSIFVTAIDTRPLAADPEVIIHAEPEAFENGIRVLRHLTDGKVFVTQKTGVNIPKVNLPKVEYHDFSGPHPAGLVGTAIHFLDPVHAGKSVWYMGYQDVMAVGRLFATGQRSLTRVISLAGPMVKDPRLVKTRQGASTDQLVAGELHSGQARVISGSILAGYRSAGWSAYLGRFNMQPSYPMTTTQNGSHRAMVPLGTYEEVVPLDILPTQLLRALLVRDTDTAQQLGALELDEEDLSLCTFVCHS
ncbi:unnamed protein product, partial [Cyprideis torosa]